MEKSQLSPLISICIPTRNAEKHLDQCLQSILLQKYPNLEVIISDDQSTDKTLAICSNFKEKAVFPVHIIQHVPSAMADNWNNSVKHANGEYIKFLFQDDVLHNDCIAKMMAGVKQGASNQFVFCNRDFLVDEALKKNRTIQNWIIRYKNLASLWKFDLSKGMDGKALLHKSSNLFAYPLNKVGEPTVTLISRKIFDNHFFNNTLQQMTDVEFYYRVFSQSYITYIPEKLVSVRLHANQQTQKNLAKKNADEDLLLFYTLKQKIGKYLHPRTNLFPIKYKAKKYVKKLLKMS